MRVLIAVVLILAACFFLFLQGFVTKEYKDKTFSGKFLSYTTLLFMGAAVMMGYLFVLYAKAF